MESCLVFSLEAILPAVVEARDFVVVEARDRGLWEMLSLAAFSEVGVQKVSNEKSE